MPGRPARRRCRRAGRAGRWCRRTSSSGSCRPGRRRGRPGRRRRRRCRRCRPGQPQPGGEPRARQSGGRRGACWSSGGADMLTATVAEPPPAEIVVTLIWPSLKVSPGWSGASLMLPPGCVSSRRERVVCEGSSSTRMLTPLTAQSVEREVLEGAAGLADLDVVPVLDRPARGVRARDAQRGRLRRLVEGGHDRVGARRRDRLDVGRLQHAEPLQVPPVAVAAAVRAHHVPRVVVLVERAGRGDRNGLAAAAGAAPAAGVVEAEVVAQLVAGHAHAQVAVDPGLGAGQVREPGPAAGRLDGKTYMTCW